MSIDLVRASSFTMAGVHNTRDTDSKHKKVDTTKPGLTRIQTCFQQEWKLGKQFLTYLPSMTT